jgi:hypothetical protein
MAASWGLVAKATSCVLMTPLAASPEETTTGTSPNLRSMIGP